MPGAFFIDRYGAEALILLATITGEELGAPLYLARNDQDIVSRGNTFKKSWFEPTLPSDNDDQPSSNIKFPNADRQIGLALMEMKKTIVVDLEFIDPNTPDVVLKSFRRLKLRSVTIDVLVVSGELMAATHDTEPYGSFRVGPKFFPGLFRI